MKGLETFERLCKYAIPLRTSLMYDDIELVKKELRDKEKNDKFIDIIRRIKESIDNSSETHCVLPNGKEITCDMSYVAEFINRCLEAYPEFKEVFE